MPLEKIKGRKITTSCRVIQVTAVRGWMENYLNINDILVELWDKPNTFANVSKCERSHVTRATDVLGIWANNHNVDSINKNSPLGQGDFDFTVLDNVPAPETWYFNLNPQRAIKLLRKKTQQLAYLNEDITDTQRYVRRNTRRNRRRR